MGHDPESSCVPLLWQFSQYPAEAFGDFFCVFCLHWSGIVAGAEPPNMKEAVFWHPCQDETFLGNIFKVRKMQTKSRAAIRTKVRVYVPVMS